MFRIIRHLLVAMAIFFVVPTALASSHQCADLKNMKLGIDEYYLELDSRKPICTKVPGTIRVRIKNPPNSDHVVARGDVTATQKPGSPLTISGNNSADRLELVINVTGPATADEEAQFLIAVKDVGVLDPKVRVVDTDVLLRLLTHAIEESLGILGLDWEDAARAVDTQLELIE
ncbi:MAG TPA: hypothetical protein PKH39_00835 [Woeseiaceae bacterium]|nr:hypothetical protein [Woeseiaceae bacterium]